MTRLILFVVLLSATLTFGGIGHLSCSAQIVPLSADSLFRLIDENSRTLKLKSLSAANADEGENIARSHRLPMLNASLSVGYLGNGYLTDRDFSDGMQVRNPHSNNNFAVEAMQLIYGGGSVENGIRLAELGAHIASLDLEQSRQEVRFALLGGLIDLYCQYNRRRVLDENMALARQVLDHMKARYDEGVVLQSDITRYELQLEQLRLQQAKTDEAVRNVNYRLANALGFPTSTTVFQPQLSPIDTAFAVGKEEAWQKQATASNLLLKKAGTGIDIQETHRKLITADLRPKLALFAYGKFDSPIVTEVPVLDKNFMYWGFGINLSYNLSSLYTVNKRVRQARIAEQESREAYDLATENVQNHVQEAYEGFLTAVTELHTQEKSLELARQNYDIVNDRFDNGIALITDMVDAANMRLSSEIGLENARAQLLFCYYRLKYVTHTL